MCLSNEKIFLVGIGAQKTGTTWLYTYLNSHPNVCLSTEKEMHVFEYRHVYKDIQHKQILVKRLRNNIEHLIGGNGKVKENIADLLIHTINKISMLDNLNIYMNYFSSKCIKQKVFGEITPAYSLLPKEGFAEIISLHNNTKFIFILRNPLERAWSHINFKHMRRNISIGYEDKLNFIFNSEINNNEFFLKSDYKTTINNLESVVNKKNILYLFYENLFSEESTINICKFLNIEHIEANFKEKINITTYENILDISDIPKNNIYTDIYDFCNDKFGDIIPKQWDIYNERK